ncbi:type II secretion system protein [Candidatus Dependentiae bacterium]|nr:type II secretion system protein [Candidatus Dependentiae bacterium]
MKSFISNSCSRVAGLTLVELMFAIVLVGTSTLSLVKLQSILLRGVFEAHALEERISILKNVFVQADREGWQITAGTKKIEVADPETKITYTLSKSSGESALGKISGLYKEQVEGSWDDIRGNRQESFISFKFSPKEPVK